MSKFKIGDFVTVERKIQDENWVERAMDPMVQDGKRYRVEDICVDDPERFYAQIAGWWFPEDCLELFSPDEVQQDTKIDPLVAQRRALKKMLRF